jgi:hypothetical protein
MDLSSAIDYVKKNGSVVERAYLGMILEEVALPMFEPLVSSYQFDNGAWSYPADETRVASVGATIDWIRLLINVRMMGTEMIGKSADFLAENQGPDGDWYETAEKLDVSPQSWLSENSDDNRLYFTAAAAAVLVGAGYVSSACTVAAAEYLERWQTDHGAFPGFARTVWAVLPVAASRFSYDSDLFLANYGRAGETVQELSLDACCWAIDMCSYAGLGPGDAVVDGVIGRLAALLGPGGLPRDPENRGPGIVADVIRVAKQSGMC